MSFPDCKHFKKDGEGIGEVTSGSFAPSLDKNIGLALVRSEHAEKGSRICVEIRGRDVEAQVVGIPFYRRREHKRDVSG